MKKIILLIITILWMIVIFIFSNQDASKSADYSDSLIKSTIVNIYKLFNNNPTEEKIEEIVETWDLPVRKLAHLTEYFILGVLMFLTLNSYNIKIIYIVILLCFLYAVSDEIHQLFVIGRYGNIIDVLIDTLGSTLGVFLVKRKKNEVY